MSFHLDTNAVIAVLKENPSSVRERFRREQLNGAEFAISAIALFELWFGVANSGHWEKNAKRLRGLLASGIAIASFDDNDSLAAGELRSTLETTGTLIGPYDLLIAAHAIRRGATLVTANAREFSKVPGLAWEDWSAT